MGIIIAGGALGGQWIDGQLNLSFPVFTVILSLAGVGISLYLVIREVTRTGRKDEEENNPNA